LNRPRYKSQNFRIRYLEYRERYHVTHTACHIGINQWASSSPSSMPLKLHVKYFKSGDRYDVALGRCTLDRTYFS